MNNSFWRWAAYNGALYGLYFMAEDYVLAERSEIGVGLMIRGFLMGFTLAPLAAYMTEMSESTFTSCLFMGIMRSSALLPKALLRGGNAWIVGRTSFSAVMVNIFFIFIMFYFDLQSGKSKRKAH